VGLEAIAVVADAGPLIHLYEIDELALLENFAALHIPDAVWKEATRDGRVLESALEYLPNLARHHLSADGCLSVSDLKHLQAGEKECLCLCDELGIPVILTDDLAAREIAQKRGLTPAGSVGVIAKCCVSGRITLNQAETALLQLYETSTLFVAKAIVENAITALRRHKDYL
jgi:predicted nucleic acid-binding protein